MSLHQIWNEYFRRPQNVVVIIVHVSDHRVEPSLDVHCCLYHAHALCIEQICGEDLVDTTGDVVSVSERQGVATVLLYRNGETYSDMVQEIPLARLQVISPQVQNSAADLPLTMIFIPKRPFSTSFRL